MLSEYSHLVSRDADSAILAINGIKVEKDQVRPQTVQCPRCQRANAPGSRFCVQCSSLLDPQAAFRDEGDKAKTDSLLNLIMSDEAIQRAILEKLGSLEPARLRELL